MKDSVQRFMTLLVLILLGLGLAFLLTSPKTETITLNMKSGSNRRIKATPEGLRYILLEPGKGAMPSQGQIVRVHYTGWLLESYDDKGEPIKGSKFDSSRDRGQPFEFPVGKGRVIKGWDLALSGMKVGERRLLILSPELGYGARGAGAKIPPNSALLFDVQLLGISSPR